MQTITFPLRLNMKRDEVSYLHIEWPGLTS